MSELQGNTELALLKYAQKNTAIETLRKSTQWIFPHIAVPCYLVRNGPALTNTLKTELHQCKSIFSDSAWSTGICRALLESDTGSSQLTQTENYSYIRQIFSLIWLAQWLHDCRRHCKERKDYTVRRKGVCGTGLF